MVEHIIYRMFYPANKAIPKSINKDRLRMYLHDNLCHSIRKHTGKMDIYPSLHHMNDFENSDIMSYSCVQKYLCHILWNKKIYSTIICFKIRYLFWYCYTDVSWCSSLWQCWVNDSKFKTATNFDILLVKHSCF